MHTHAVKGLIKCRQHDSYIIHCRQRGFDCQPESQDQVRKRFKKLGIKSTPIKAPWLAVLK